MHPSIEQIRALLVSATEGITDAGWRRSRGEGKWTAMQILEHLSLTYSLTATGSDAVLAANRPMATQALLRQRLAVWVVVELGRFPQGRQAPQIVNPSGIESVYLPQALEHLMTMDAALTACESRFGLNTGLMDHPILGPMSARRWRKFHVVHAKHHAPQLKALRGV